MTIIIKIMTFLLKIITSTTISTKPVMMMVIIKIN